MLLVIRSEWGFHGVVSNVLDCEIVSELELQSRYDIRFQMNTLGKGINLLIPPHCYRLTSDPTVLLRRWRWRTQECWYVIEQRNQTKSNHTVWLSILFLKNCFFFPPKVRGKCLWYSNRSWILREINHDYLLLLIAQSAGADEYIDRTSAEGYDPHQCVS